VNDAKHVREFLISAMSLVSIPLCSRTDTLPPSGHGRYKTSDILLLTDDSKDSRSLPTRDNLIQAMKWLVRGAKKDDSLFFHCEETFFIIFIFLVPFLHFSYTRQSRFLGFLPIFPRCHPWHLPGSRVQSL
jgi:hypothetical protein